MNEVKRKWGVLGLSTLSADRSMYYICETLNAEEYMQCPNGHTGVELSTIVDNGNVSLRAACHQCKVKQTITRDDLPEAV